MMSNQILDVKNLNLDLYTEDSTVRILNNITFAVKRGESLGLIGETGCGKTLTSRSIIGLLPKSMHVSGKMVFDGTDLSSSKSDEVKELRRRRIALVPQNAMTALDPLFSIRQLMYEILGRGMSKEEKQSRCQEALKSVELDPDRVLRSRPYELSGGMAQRTLIAMALIRNPEMIIADEFTSAVDIETQTKLLALMNRLRKEKNLSIIVITHDMDVVRAMCDRICVMYLGRIVESSSVSEILNNPKHPYTQALLAAIPRVGGIAPRPITGTVPSITALASGCKYNPRCPYVMDICRKIEPQLMMSDKSLVACYLYDKHGES